MANVSDSPQYILESEDGQVKHKLDMLNGFSRYSPREIYEGMMNFQWMDGDVMMSVFGKCGTHLVWELAQMLLRASSEFTDVPKELAFIDLRRADIIHDVPSPKVINTHIRVDVLPKEFQNRKTIVVIRNAKDALVSGYHHVSGFTSSLAKAQNEVTPELNYETIIKMFLHSRPGYIGYCDFYSYYWKRRNDPNILFLHYEEVVRNPRPQVARIDAFLGTNQSEKLMDEIAAASSFEKMKAGKSLSEETWQKDIVREDVQEKFQSKNISLPSLWRKGKIGDWKNHLSVALSEQIDDIVAEWIKRENLEGLDICYE